MLIYQKNHSEVVCSVTLASDTASKWGTICATIFPYFGQQIRGANCGLVPKRLHLVRATYGDFVQSIWNFANALHIVWRWRCDLGIFIDFFFTFSRVFDLVFSVNFLCGFYFVLVCTAPPRVFKWSIWNFADVFDKVWTCACKFGHAL